MGTAHYVILLMTISWVCGHGYSKRPKQKMEQIFSWKQLTYDFDGMFYTTDTACRNPDGAECETKNGKSDLKDSEKFFIQYNNVPIGLEKFCDKIFVTVPRRRYGIPSTLNYVGLYDGSSPALKPYPGADHRVSHYRPRVDECDRLWVVDTGMLEVPEGRVQVQPPAILIYNLKTERLITRYELKSSVLVNERTPAGLTSITVDVDPSDCDDAYAYINDLATEGLVVFSLKERDSWRIEHDSFKHVADMNFTVSGHVLNWKDGVFSIALSEINEEGKRTAYYHPLMSTEEFAVDTAALKNKHSDFGSHVRLLGDKGPNTQSGSHAYHAATKTLLFANLAQNAILCWRVDTEMAPANVVVVARDDVKMVYISDLKVVDDEVWVLVNQIPKFVYSKFNTGEDNFYVHKGNIRTLIRGTACDKKRRT